MLDGEIAEMPLLQAIITSLDVNLRELGRPILFGSCLLGNTSWLRYRGTTSLLSDIDVFVIPKRGCLLNRVEETASYVVENNGLSTSDSCEVHLRCGCDWCSTASLEARCLFKNATAPLAAMDVGADGANIPKHISYASLLSKLMKLYTRSGSVTPGVLYLASKFNINDIRNQKQRLLNINELTRISKIGIGAFLLWLKNDITITINPYFGTSLNQLAVGCQLDLTMLRDLKVSVELLASSYLDSEIRQGNLCMWEGKSKHMQQTHIPLRFAALHARR